MASTTNFNWTTPDDTDLVKDGAAAIRTLGSAIDTSLVDLKGGTTGQVLSKASNTDLDYSWTTPTDQTPLTTKGDLFGYSTADARIPVGTNGQVLTADSAETLGLKWADPVGGGKVLQVVQATYSTATTIASTSFTDTGLSVTITPSAATSKILIIGTQQVFAERSVTTVGVGIQLLRDATAVWVSGTGGYESLSLNENAEVLFALRGLLSISYMDTPNTTSATTYKTQGKVFSTANSGTSTYQENSSPSVLIAMEIGA